VQAGALSSHQLVLIYSWLEMFAEITEFVLKCQFGEGIALAGWALSVTIFEMLHMHC